MGDHWGTGSVASNSFFSFFTPSFLACFLASTKRGEGGLFYTTRDLDRSIAPSIGVGKLKLVTLRDNQWMDECGRM